MYSLTNNQRSICEKFGSKFIPALRNLKVGLARQTLELSPVYGVREPLVGDTTGWYIWAGPHSDDPDFFQAVHAEHLSDILPLVMPYLGLEPGFKFIIDASGYEDVWFEPK